MPRRVLEGEVVSDKGDKTVVVNVTRRFKHKLYKKFIFKTKHYTAHDENNEIGVGDTVLIEECSPISKTKRFKVVELKEKARIASVIVEDEVKEVLQTESNEEADSEEETTQEK
tara:strand:+ start:824 stop:1165 length:342 start_codon:yes stop_codon:yes gene_type:complete